MATATTWISKHQSRCGGDACVRDTRITIWGLESFRRLGMSDEQILATVPGLTAPDLDAAWEFVAMNPAEIGKAIRENEAGEEGFVE